MTGRKPDPAPIRLLKNDKNNAHRYKDKQEPVPSDEPPVAPEYLSVRAKEIFNKFVKLVEEMYPVSETDINMIVRYARLGERIEAYDGYLRRTGDTYETINDTKPKPEVKMMQDCEDRQHKIEVEFGLSPSSRARVNVKPKEKKKQNSFGALNKTKNG